MTRLAGKCAMITGAARGIGQAFAKAYVAEGARVIIADIDDARATETANAIGDSAMAVRMDVTDTSSIAAAIAQAQANGFGPIDILINNAAIFTAAPIVEITETDFDRVFDINVKGTLFTMQSVAQHMIENGVKGRIINMASQAGRRGEPLGLWRYFWRQAPCCSRKPPARLGAAPQAAPGVRLRRYRFAAACAGTRPSPRPSS